MTIKIEHRGLASGLDHVGMVISFVCAIHCLLAPLVLAFLPLLGATFLADEVVENLLLLTAILIGAASLIPGHFMHHRRYLPLAVFGTGALLVIAGRFTGDEVVWLEAIFSSSGAILFAVSHFINYRICGVCCRSDERG